MTPTLTETAPGRFELAGEVTFATVTRLWQRSRSQLARCRGSVTLDLGGIEHADSAAFALLLEWLRLARCRGFELRLIHPPERLRTMARAYDLDVILPFHG
ncbi:phospholipid transport system transporter-binding protein [Methylomarinovum caldicuralii]|uniref:Phospholipid transport system transporter-binding protein n=1 Tax=Methylomarinovum caldicuralii TaxID=438856 RepID=A0AAU9C2T0_9GAMM|nr:STAS domain-containing protein [Methylomarinovum caldicuralii]BCX81480.1 phospholipid transport system transporter-binding protein [Methylomarinovum caldicuralii]